MEFVVEVSREESLTAALAGGVEGIAVRIPPEVVSPSWPDLRKWRDAAQRKGVKFYLVWDRLVREGELTAARELLAAAAELAPDGLELRDLGLALEARERYPQLPLRAASSWGAHNSPGLLLAETIGFSGVVLAGPITLKDLALLRRHTSLPLEVALPPFGQDFPGLCLLEDYLGAPCSSNPFPVVADPAQAVLASLDFVAGLAPLGIGAVRVPGELFSAAALVQLLDLLQTVGGAATRDRPKLMAAAREVAAAFGERFRTEGPPEEPAPEAAPTEKARGGSPFPRFPSGPQAAKARVWLEARDYPEAAALALKWRDPVIAPLNPTSYAAFLQEHRHWTPRRLIWRLPPVIREGGLGFYQQAAATLHQMGYSRFLAGDWGGVALLKAARAEIFGDQSLGVRNSLALRAARRLGVAKVCLPSGQGPQDWQPLAEAGAGGFWGYLYQVPALAVYPAAEALPPPLIVRGEKLRWAREGDLFLLCRRQAERQEEALDWLLQRRVSPLIISLPRSGLPRGQQFLEPARAGAKKERRART